VLCGCGADLALFFFLSLFSPKAHFFKGFGNNVKMLLDFPAPSQVLEYLQLFSSGTKIIKM
jgi:hypothetical protein